MTVHSFGFRCFEARLHIHTHVCTVGAALTFACGAPNRIQSRAAMSNSKDPNVAGIEGSAVALRPPTASPLFIFGPCRNELRAGRSPTTGRCHAPHAGEKRPCPGAATQTPELGSVRKFVRGCLSNFAAQAAVTRPLLHLFAA